LRRHACRGRCSGTAAAEQRGHDPGDPLSRPDDECAATRFAADVAGALRAAARGDVVHMNVLLREAPQVLDETGPHPYWGGRPRPLQVAAEWNREDVARALLEAGADPNADAASYDGWSPLLLAASKGHASIVGLLMAHGARVGIFEACALGDEDAVERLLAGDPGLARAAGPGLATPLHFAASPAIARRLLRAGADTSARDRWGNTPIRTAAASTRRRPVAETLLPYADARDIHLAAALDRTDQVAALLDADGARIHDRTFEHDAVGGGGTALHAAAQQAAAGVVRLLLDRGADPNARGLGGETPLHYASAHGHIDIAALLLERGADPNVRDTRHAATPRDWADFHQRTAMVAWFDALG
jgi:ankyrin repeat protein